MILLPRQSQWGCRPTLWCLVFCSPSGLFHHDTTTHGHLSGLGTVKTVAIDLGHAFKTISIPFGGGGTDGGQFARDKIKTINIIGTPTSAFRKEIIFHSMKDSPDKISKKAVSAVIKVVSEYLKKIDITETNS